MTKSIADGFPSTPIPHYDQYHGLPDIPERSGRIMRAAKYAGAVVAFAVVGTALIEGATFLTDHFGSTNNDQAARVANQLTPTEKSALRTIQDNHTNQQIPH